jgi:hypothetical protein
MNGSAEKSVWHFRHFLPVDRSSLGCMSASRASRLAVTPWPTCTGYLREAPEGR